MSDETENPAQEENLSQEQLRERLEERLRTVRMQDLLMETVASIVNLSARRIAKEDERDLEQGRLGIDAVEALLPLLPSEAENEVRTALSELQMLFARFATGQGAGPAQPGPSEGRAEPGSGQEPSEPGQRPREEPGTGGGGQRPSRLWTPPGSV